MNVRNERIEELLTVREPALLVRHACENQTDARAQYEQRDSMDLRPVACEGP